MKALSIVCALLAIGCLVAVLMNASLISDSFNVATSGKDGSLQLQISELNNISDPEVLRLAAITNAELESTSVTVMSQYIVWFYSSLLALGFISALSAYLAWLTSNKSFKQDRPNRAVP